ncbi:P-loop containing nucleoside triphosphate hydrolase protein [Chytriomyces sp. MP71]|nr:P-loop containing nucleoside triphosphate hydrolase protein [Chytriomyces sp. MP71]
MPELTAAEEKLLSQRPFLEKEMAKLEVKLAPTSDDAAAPFRDNDVVQDDRDMVVCVRARPLLRQETDRGLFPSVSTSPESAIDPKVFLHQLEYSLKGTPRLKTHEFPVDHAFSAQASNEEVYTAAARSLIPIALGGGVGSLFASGQTGSGKTFTMTAIENLIARDLFQFAKDYRVKQDGVESATVSDSADFEFLASFFEILGTQATDLLNYPTELTILEDVMGHVQVKGVTEQQVTNSQQLMDLISKGAAYRKTVGTAKNDTSSRSHAVCRIRIKDLRHPDADEGILYLLDLAGSESASDSRQHDKERMAESVEINKSLTTLKECIRNRALAVLSTKHVHIPYRNSKLTILLKAAFELASDRACKTVVIATLNPSILDTNHSLNTLRYISPLKVQVPVSTEKDSNDPSSWSNATLKTWVSHASDAIDPEILCPAESGKQILKLPEAAFVDRCCKCPGVSVKVARAFYNKLWRLVVDARTKIRRDKEEAVKKALALRELEAKKDAADFRKRLTEEPEAYERWMQSRLRGLEWEKEQEEKLQTDPAALAMWREDRKAAKEYYEQFEKETDEYIDDLLASSDGGGLREMAKKLKELEEKKQGYAF